MSRAEYGRMLISLLLVAVLYTEGRYLGLTGPGSHVQFEPWIWPAMAIIAIWGLWRLMKRD